MTPVRQPAGVGFALRDPLPWPEFATVVRAGELLGYAGVFLPEIRARDAFAALTGLAGQTRDLLLGTGVVPMRSRTPALTAMAAATVQERSGGRLVLGIGTGSVGRGALEELERTVAEVRSLLAAGGARLALSPGAQVPVWISAMGARAFELGGRIADGVLMNWCDPERVALGRRAVAEGAAAAGRDPAEITLAVYVRSWVGPDLEAATRALKQAAGEYATYSTYRRQFGEMGVAADAEAAASAVAQGRVEDVPDRMIEAFTAIGDRARGRIAQYVEAGASLPIVYPVAVGDPAPSILGTLVALAPRSV